MYNSVLSVLSFITKYIALTILKTTGTIYLDARFKPLWLCRTHEQKNGEVPSMKKWVSALLAGLLLITGVNALASSKVKPNAYSLPLDGMVL